MDIHLSGESGFDLARELRAGAASDAPRVILMSTHAENDFADLIAASPAEGFVPKYAFSAQTVHRVLDGDLIAPRTSFPCETFLPNFRGVCESSRAYVSRMGGDDLTVPEAAAALGTSPQTVRALLRKGDFGGQEGALGQSLPLGYQPADVDAFLAEHGRLDGHRRRRASRPSSRRRRKSLQSRLPGRRR